MPVTIMGGEKVNKFFKNAGKGGVKGFEVGFFASAKYTNGILVAAVAAWNEFGTEMNGKEHTPERSFFRTSLKDNERKLLSIIKNNIDTKRMVVDYNLAKKLGTSSKGSIQKSIADWKDPPNAPSTLARKKPKTNPLVHTGKMARSVTYKVNK